MVDFAILAPTEARFAWTTDLMVNCNKANGRWCAVGLIVEEVRRGQERVRGLCSCRINTNRANALLTVSCPIPVAL